MSRTQPAFPSSATDALCMVNKRQPMDPARFSFLYCYCTHDANASTLPPFHLHVQPVCLQLLSTSTCAVMSTLNQFVFDEKKNVNVSALYIDLSSTE